MSAREKGFTLIEVLVAVVIMVGGIVVMANAWSGNFMRVRNSRINNTAAALLERKMTEIEVQYKDKPIEEIKESDAGEFGSMFPGYTWEMASKEFEMPDISSSLLAKESTVDPMLITMIKTTTEFINKSVKEVSVTVSFKPKKGNPIHHTVTTYFVDYTKQMDIPGLGGGAAGGGSTNSANQNQNQNPSTTTGGGGSGE